MSQPWLILLIFASVTKYYDGMNRPFVYGYLAENENFIDRDEDRRQLKNFLGNGINVMLISPRRWGKSSLVKKTMQEMAEEDKTVRVCFVDAFKVHSEKDFYNAYASAIVRGLSSSLEKGIELVKDYIQAFTPSITLKSDPLNAIEVDLSYKPIEKRGEDILNLPEQLAVRRGLHVIVCIDEFQQLARLPEWNRMEATMRSVWQHHQHVNYCLYGSKRHMMMDIFNNAANPFYRFGQVLYLKKIAKVHWIPYIQDAFHKTGKHIDTVLAERICDTVECHPWYVQQLSFFVWSDTLTEATNEIFERQVQTLIDTNAPQFETDINALAPSQVGMLIAIANREEQLSAKLTVERYGLGGSQTIARNKKTLVEKDIVEYDAQRGYQFVDPVFCLWFKQQYLPGSVSEE